VVNPSNGDFINIFELPSIELKKQDAILVMGEYVLKINSDTFVFTSGLYPRLARNRCAAVRIESDINSETL